MANGEFCGGGFHSNPRAALCDGQIDILQILPVSRLTFLRLIGSYKAGTHLDGDKNAAILNAFKCRSLRMAFDRDQNICIDGDVSQTRELFVEVVPNAVRVVLPRGCALCRPAPAPVEVTV
jgi:diacylglycerol kinase family enzyme